VRTVTQAVDEILALSAELRFGFSKGLFNLTQLAKFIRPMVEARTFKEVRETSLVMALSRRQRGAGTSAAQTAARQFAVENLSLLSNLSVMTLLRSDENHRAVEQVYTRLKRKGSFFTVSEGTSEITIIFSSEYRAVVSDILPGRPKLARDKVAALSVRFNAKYLEVPGLLYKILEQIALQGVNVIEIASTSTELIVYINESDVRIAFDTLLRAFVERARRSAS
jgi:aspartokinase